MLTEYPPSQISRSRDPFRDQTSTRTFCEKHRSNSCCTYYGHLTLAFMNYALLNFHLDSAFLIPLWRREEAWMGQQALHL